ncbi:MAG: methyltransferase domain-containing protein [Deltaproteobacteria bacterium]|nr:methyltransferase domain-containing protein [Deltaproteobacteria bacterium]
MKTLDVGCGPNKEPGSFGVDHAPFEGVDLVHDLDATPWPLADSSFERANASHIVEHVEDMVDFFREIHRVCAPGAEVRIVTPHFTNRCAYLDPTHRRYLSVRFVDFIAEVPPWYPASRFAVARSYLGEHHHSYPSMLPGMFELRDIRITFARVFRWLGIEWLANRKPDFYEFFLAYLAPARDIVATLRVVKET